MLYNPVLAEWEMQMRVKDKQVEMERKRLVRLAASSGVAPASLSLKSLQNLAASALARSSSLAKTAWQTARPWFSQPAAAEEACAET